MHNTIEETIGPDLTPTDKKDRPKTILVVDDNSAVADIIVITLRRLGHACVEVARGGKQALEMAARLRPDLVIMDIDMPEMDGIETARHLNVLHPCSIIFSTGLCDSKTMRRTREMPSVSYLVKPFSPAQLQAAVHHS
jgi:CheY-like chemotaxis protein